MEYKCWFFRPVIITGLCQRNSGTVKTVMESFLMLLCICALVHLEQSLKEASWEGAAAAAMSCQSCPTLCDPIDGSPPGSPVPGTLQARILEWVAISFSNAWKWKVTVKSLSRVWLLATPWTAAYQAPPSMGFSRQEYWSGGAIALAWEGDSQLKMLFSLLLFINFSLRENNGPAISLREVEK